MTRRPLHPLFDPASLYRRATAESVLADDGGRRQFIRGLHALHVARLRDQWAFSLPPEPQSWGFVGSAASGRELPDSRRASDESIHRALLDSADDAQASAERESIPFSYDPHGMRARSSDAADGRGRPPSIRCAIVDVDSEISAANLHITTLSMSRRVMSRDADPAKTPAPFLGVAQCGDAESLVCRLSGIGSSRSWLLFLLAQDYLDDFRDLFIQESEGDVSPDRTNPAGLAPTLAQVLDSEHLQLSRSAPERRRLTLENVFRLSHVPVLEGRSEPDSSLTVVVPLPRPLRGELQPDVVLVVAHSACDES